MDKYLDHRSTYDEYNSRNNDEYDRIKNPLHDGHVKAYKKYNKKPLVVDESIDAVLRTDAYWSEVRSNSTAYNKEK